MGVREEQLWSMEATHMHEHHLELCEQSLQKLDTVLENKVS